MNRFRECIRLNLVLLLLFSAVVAQADDGARDENREKEFLTVDRLLASGYRQLSGQQLIALMNTKKIVVTDIATDRVVVSGNDKGTGMERSFNDEKEVSHKKVMYFLDTRLLARAPRLQGDIRRRVVADELVSTDGVRTYHFRVYAKGDRMFAARDIDHGNVYYEIKTE